MTDIEDTIVNAIGIAVVKAAYDMENNAIENVPVDTGKLRRSINVEVVPTSDGYRINFNVGTNYSAFVEYGTPPHDILPKNKKALRFEVGKKQRLGAKLSPSKGNFVITRRVKHPGTRPQPFMVPALHTAINTYIPKRIKEELAHVG